MLKGSSDREFFPTDDVDKQASNSFSVLVSASTYLVSEYDNVFISTDLQSVHRNTKHELLPKWNTGVPSSDRIHQPQGIDIILATPRRMILTSP